MEQVFRIADLKKIDNPELKINKSEYTVWKYHEGQKHDEEIKPCLSFTIGNDSYGFSFYSTISPKDFLDFEMNKRINFTEYIRYDDYDVSNNGKYSPIDFIHAEIIHYLDHKFLINILITSDDTVADMQCDFDISDYLDEKS